jgi:hypothetical protein
VKRTEEEKETDWKELELRIVRFLKNNYVEPTTIDEV